MRYLLPLMLFLITLYPLHAQDSTSSAAPSTFGLAFGLWEDISVGALWRLSDAIALRPMVQFSYNNQDETNPDGFEYDGNGITVRLKLSGLYHLYEKENLSVFTGIGGGVSWSRGTGDVHEVGTAVITSYRRYSTFYETFGMFGAEYRVLDQLHVFGEVRASYELGSDEVREIGSQQASDDRPEHRYTGYSVGDILLGCIWYLN